MYENENYKNEETEEKIEKYTLVGIKKKTSKKTNNDYYIAYVLYENNYGFDILNIMLQSKQLPALKQVIGDETFDLKPFIGVKYNSFQKRYDTFINYGL